MIGIIYDVVETDQCTIGLVWSPQVPNARIEFPKTDLFLVGDWIEFNDIDWKTMLANRFHRIKNCLPTKCMPLLMVKTTIAFAPIDYRSNDNNYFDGKVAWSHDFVRIGVFKSYISCQSNCIYQVWVERLDTTRVDLSNKYNVYWCVIDDELRVADDQKLILNAPWNAIRDISKQVVDVPPVIEDTSPPATMFVTVWSAQTRQASIRSFLMRNGLEVGTWLRFNARYEPNLDRYDYLISEYDIIPAHLVTRINENNEVMCCLSLQRRVTPTVLHNDIIGSIVDEERIVKPDSSFPFHVWILKINPDRTGYSWAVIRTATRNDVYAKPYLAIDTVEQSANMLLINDTDSHLQQLSNFTRSSDGHNRSIESIAASSTSHASSIAPSSSNDTECVSLMENCLHRLLANKEIRNTIMHEDIDLFNDLFNHALPTV